MPIVVEQPRLSLDQQFTQDCPACEGIMPAEAITWGDITPGRDDFGLFLHREVSMYCPHCGHWDSRDVRFRVADAPRALPPPHPRRRRKR